MRWRISVYDAQGSIDLPAGPARFIYALSNDATLRDAGGTVAIPAESGRFCRGAAQLSGAGVAWVFEAGPEAPLLAGPGVSLVLSHPIGLPAPGQRLLRADRIESPPGSRTPRHGHRGPGIRRLLYGRILGEIGERWERIDPDHAWFETGTDPVIGANIHTGNSAFVRVMVLPPELHGGKASFVASDAAEAAKPRAVQNRVFEEMLVEATPAA